MSQMTSHSGCPGAVAACARSSELGGCGVEVREVDDGDAVEAVGVVGELLGEEVVATSDAGGPVGPEEFEQLPPPAGVHDAVVNADAVHPSDPLGRRGVVLGMQDHRTAAVVRHLGERRQQRATVWAVVGRERAQEVAGNAVREELDADGQPVEPRLQGMLAGCERPHFPVRVDIDDDGHD